MIDRNKGGMLFWMHHTGGTGKTILQPKHQSELVTVSSGIAAKLLTGGHALHSTFKIPLDLHAMHGHSSV